MAGIKNDFITYMNKEMDARTFVEEHQTACYAGTAYLLLSSVIGTATLVVGMAKIGKTVKGFLR